MTSSDHSLAEDIAAIARLDVVPTILEVVCRATGLGFAAVARVTDERWIACAVRDEIQFGLQPGGELRVATTICGEVRESGNRVVIDHVDEDAAFANHPTARLYGFQSFISVPIRLPNGRFFGTLCAIDPQPAQLKTPATIGMFELFADLIGQHLDAQERLHHSQTALVDERARAELQDQFIAVLGHDLRNPLSAIQTGAKALLLSPLDERAARVAAVIERSAVRMGALIDDVLDFARGRLGGGIAVHRATEGSLQQLLEQVIGEMRTAQPERAIVADLGIDHPVVCDRGRIGQLFSNLLGNALAHGDPAGPVRVRAQTTGARFELSVANRGEIAPDTRWRLFQPFARASAQRHAEGLGLGLYIASEIARAHHGTLEVLSAAGETCFTFSMPA